MQICGIKVYNDYFIDKGKHMTENSMVMARRAILKQINEKSKSDLSSDFHTLISRYDGHNKEHREYGWWGTMAEALTQLENIHLLL